MAPKVSWFTKAPEGTFDLRFDSVCILVLCFGSNLFVLNEICPFAFVEEVGINNLETFCQSKILSRGFRLIAHVKSQLDWPRDLVSFQQCTMEHFRFMLSWKCW